MFPHDKLSIQVHPDDAYAAAHEQAAGGRANRDVARCFFGSWRQPAIGLKKGIDRQKFLDALQANRLEDVFQSHSVTAGDTFFVVPGTPHTIGPGMVLCEYSNIRPNLSHLRLRPSR